MKLEEALQPDGNFNNMLKSMMPEKVYDRLEFVEVKSYKENEELKKLIESKVPESEITKKQCFRNSALVASLINDVDYVEGYVGLNLGGSILPIEHAWNVYKENFYFDITSDFQFDGDLGKGKKNYAKLITIAKPEKARKAAEDARRATYHIMKGDM